MKNTKIVKRISALAIATVLGLGVVSCAKKNSENLDEITTQQTIVDENVNEIVVQGDNQNETTNGETSVDTEGPTDETTKKVGSVELYSPVDFSKVKNLQETYDELLAKREIYNSEMKSVLSVRVLHSQEEIHAAIYNVARIDSDLSSLIVKIYKQTKEDVKDEFYLADQIEKLENVLNKMQSLKSKIETSKQDYSDALEHISKADAEQIEKVHKFCLMPLNSPIKSLGKEIEELKIELQEALANQ